MAIVTKLRNVEETELECIEEIKEVIQKKKYIVPMESVVIYNKFDIHSLMAAAVYSGRVSPLTGEVYQLFDSTALLHTDFNEYVWVGVTPDKSIKGFIHKTIKKKANHIKIEIDHFDEELQRKVTIYEEAVKQTGGNVSHSFALGNALEHFFDKWITIEELVFVHKNYVKAKECIETGVIFEPVSYANHVSSVDKTSFLSFINKVKAKLKHSYKPSWGIIGGKKFKYCLLALNIDEYSWAIRLVRMSHRYYLNVTNCLRGYVIDTNISDLSQMKLVDDYRYLNSY